MGWSGPSPVVFEDHRCERPGGEVTPADLGAPIVTVLPDAAHPRRRATGSRAGVSDRP